MRVLHQEMHVMKVTGIGKSIYVYFDFPLMRIFYSVNCLLACAKILFKNMGKSNLSNRKEK